ncbi:hypothetical protein [Streptomyces pactum]|uniref:hypothetical protein n=1 Tax=Streptomyces pactum TaxID=68249 RepID=UPI0006E2AA3D|nr:hypothetical protein [Streptomyces pactum]
MAENDGTRRPSAAGAVLLAATVAAGSVAGTFCAFAHAVLPAPARSDDRVYVDVMRDVNDVIQNPVFLCFLCFLGALVLACLAGWQLRRMPGRRWVRAGAPAYALASLVTAGAGVPLNDALARAGDPAVLRERSRTRGWPGTSYGRCCRRWLRGAWPPDWWRGGGCHARSARDGRPGPDRGVPRPPWAAPYAAGGPYAAGCAVHHRPCPYAAGRAVRHGVCPRRAARQPPSVYLASVAGSRARR